MWCREGEGWIVGLDSARTFVRDSKGMRHLAHLIARPGEETSALDLVAAEEGTPVAAAQDAGPQLDAKAKAEYRERLEALAAEIAKAERLGDAARSERASAEFAFLTRELKGAIGLGGRDRKSGSSVERARVNVTRSIRSAIDRIARQDEALAAHLAACVRTGAFCVYEPHRDDPVHWNAAPARPAAPPSRAAEPAAATLTVMFMDIEDSTALMERLGEHQWLEVLAAHNDVVRTQLARHGGREVKAMGDGFMLTFDSARAAVWCAVDVQRELHAHTKRDPDRPLRVRTGIHCGAAVRDGDDLLGRTVVVAARLCQQARGGQILVSDELRGSVGDLGDIGVGELNVVHLRGLRGSHRVHELVWDGSETGPAPPSASGSAALGRLLEREAEMKTLETALDGARDCAGSLVAIEGPPGIGKSSLVGHVVDRADSAGFTTIRARATQLEQERAFGTAARLFEPALRAMDAGRLEGLLKGPVRPVAAMLGYDEPVEAEFAGDSNAMHIFNGLFWLAAALAEDAPLVIAVDDAHWADARTLEWIEYAADRVRDTRILLLASGRGGPDARMAGVTGAAATVIAPRALSVDAATAAVRAVWPEATMGFARACHATTGGNPFFLREMLTSARAAGIDPTDEGVRRLPEATPDSVARTVRARIDKHGRPARTLARALAVLGGQGELSLVTELADLEPAVALAAADALDEAEVVEGAGTLSFAHPLIGAVVERDLRAGERAVLHERAARLLLGRHAAPEEVAVHLLHARPSADPATVATLRRAARGAAQRGAPAAAAQLLERAVSEPPSAAELPEVLLELGRVLLDAAEDARATRYLERALALAATPRLRGEIVLTLSGIDVRPDATRRIGQIDALIPELGDEDRELRFALEARAIELLGDLMMATPSPQITAAHDERLRRVVDEAAGDSAGERQLVAISAVHRVIRADITAAEARHMALHALDDGALTRRLAGGAWSADSAVEVLLMADAFEEADRHARDAERHAREAGATTAEAYACLLRAAIALVRGSLLDVESLLRSVFAITRQLKGPKYVEYVAQLVRACSAIERGDLDVAARAADALVQEGVRPWAAPVAHGRLHAARGDHDLAVAALSSAYELHRAAGLWRTTLASPAPDLVFSLVAVGRRDEALEVAREELDRSRRFGAASAVGSALRALGHADEPDRAVDHLRAAADVLASSLALLTRGHVLCDLGAALSASGQRQEAGHTLRQALELSVQCGARRLTERARGELALAGVRPPVIEQTGPQLLSPAERRVAELAAEGASEVEIAQALFLSPRVVAEQLATAIGKLGLASRDELEHAMRQQRPLVA